MDSIPMRLMKERRYELLPVDQIVVPHPRDRGSEQFALNIRSIKDVGLLKPILVNERFTPETGTFELVCGEGRLTAHRRLEKPEIAAEIIDCDPKEAYLISLLENIARVPAGTMWFAHEVKRMRDAGMELSEISRIVGKSESYIAMHITLVERGEERLLQGVEEGRFPITLALRIAESDEAQVRGLLMDAYDTGLVTTGNLRPVREVIEDRLKRLKARGTPPSPSPDAGESPYYTVAHLKEDIAKTVREKKLFVREASAKEGRLVCLAEGLKALHADEGFMTLLKAEGLAEMPELGSKDGGSGISN